VINVSVTTAWYVLRLRMNERPPVWWVAANILNKQAGTADKEWSFSFGIGQVAKKFLPYKLLCYEMFTQKSSDLDGYLVRAGSG